MLNQTGLEMNLQVDPQPKQKRPQQRMIDSLTVRMDGVLGEAPHPFRSLASHHPVHAPAAWYINAKVISQR